MLRIRIPLRALLVCLAVCAMPVATASASHSQTLFFDSPHDLLNPVTRAKSIAQLQKLGVKALRVELYWDEVVPEPLSATKPSFEAENPDRYHWGQYDALLAEAQRLKWQVLLTVTAPVPKWATATHQDLVTRPDDKLFEEFMVAVGRRYSSEVSLWAIWNEPNIPGWLMPQWNANGTPASPRIYRGLFQAGYAGLQKAGISNPKVLFGETAPFGEDKVYPRTEGKGALHHELAPLEFLREALCLNSSYHKASTCSMLPVYGYAHHPYTYPARQGVSYRPPNRDQVTIGSLSRLSSALDKAASAHAIPAHDPIYLTEYGVQAKPNELGVSLSEQVEYDAISEKIAWENPRVASFSQYLLTDETPHGRLKGYRTGLETSNRSPKPLYFAFPVPLVVTKQSSDFSLWGYVRPATEATTVTVMIEPKGSSHFKVLREVRTNSLGYWTLHSTTAASHWRIRWTSPAGVKYEGPPIKAN
jgi:Cellulase (glycosyl hydrolase family 5)